MMTFDIYNSSSSRHCFVRDGLCFPFAEHWQVFCFEFAFLFYKQISFYIFVSNGTATEV